MTGSLRTRFFLATWPVVLVATLGLGLVFDAWAGRRLLELDREVVESSEGSELPGEVRDALASWAAGGLDEGALAAAVHALDPPWEVIVLDPAGAVSLATDSAWRPVGPLRTEDPGTVAEFERITLRGDVRESDLFVVSGIPLTDAAGRSVGTAFPLPNTLDDPSASSLVPAPASPSESTGALLRRDARRLLLWATASALVLSGLLALLLARPLVGQLERLARAAERIRDGRLDTRVEPGRPDELGRLERAFNAMAVDLEEAERHQRDLVSDAAHELRTPLTNLIGALDAIRDGVRSPDPATLTLLRQQAAILEERVDDLQELSLAESGQLDLRSEPVDVVGVMRDVAVSARAGGACMPIEDPPAGTPPTLVLGDTRRLMQVIGNLVRNAVAHTPCDGRVRLGVERRDGSIVMSVSDTGAGIPPEHLPRVWDRFYRVESSRDRRSGGSGLGLAIVRQLVRLMDGRVAVRSEPGAGSVFEVVFPEAPSVRTGSDTSASPRTPDPRAPSGPRPPPGHR